MTDFKDQLKAGVRSELQPIPAHLMLGGSWQTRAVIATRGNQTLLGAIVCAVLGKAPSNPPRIASGAVITKDGDVLAHFQSRDGEWHEGSRVCAIEDLIGNFRGLADHLKLNDPDREAMFRELSMWITTDERAESGDLFH